MKKIFCPKCDGEIALSVAKLQTMKAEREERIPIVCTHCTHQLYIRRKLSTTKVSEKTTTATYGHITIVENAFGYQQKFVLRKGLNHIGRRNKDTKTDIPIITSDPSMDRHHAIIKVSISNEGDVRYALADDDSRVGTFVFGTLLAAKEWYNLSDGDIFTLGATTLIFSTSPLNEGDGVEQVPRP